MGAAASTPAAAGSPSAGSTTINPDNKKYESALPEPLARLARRLLAPATFEDVGDYTPTGQATGVYMLRLPFSNVYFCDGILIDSGTRLDFGRIQNALDRLGACLGACTCGYLLTLFRNVSVSLIPVHEKGTDPIPAIRHLIFLYAAEITQTPGGQYHQVKAPFLVGHAITHAHQDHQVRLMHRFNRSMNNE
jgi:hypothetical protein